MGKLRLNRTQSTQANDPIINRANQVRRDTDTIKTPSCTIYDVDYAIISYIRDIIQPRVEEDGSIITVPIQYASGEKWSQIQKHGYMRDVKGKLMAPIITLRRNSMSTPLMASIVLRILHYSCQIISKICRKTPTCKRLTLKR